METITPTPAVVRAGEGRHADLGDHRVRVKVASADSAGTLLLGDMDVDAGGGVPPHVHTREDEAFVIQAGRFEFLVGESTIEAGPGDTVFAPRNIPHAWRCVSPGGGRAVLLITPGANFEAFAGQMAARGCDPQADMADPVKVAEFMALCAAHGIHMLPALK